MSNRKMKIYIMITSLLAFLLLATGCSNEAGDTSEQAALSEVDEYVIEDDKSNTNTIRLRVVEFPPFYYENGSDWTGLEVELAKALIYEAGYSPEYVVLPWTRALKAMEVGGSDIMMNLVKTPEREEYMDFIGPIRSSKMALVVHSDYKDQSIETIDELFSVSGSLGIPIGLQRDVKYPIELANKLEDEAYSQYMDFSHATKTYPSNVIDRRIMGFVEDEIAMKYQIINNPDYKGLALHPFEFSEDDVYIGISKHIDAEKYDNLQKAFNRLKDSGKFTKIIDEY